MQFYNWFRLHQTLDEKRQGLLGWWSVLVAEHLNYNRLKDPRYIYRETLMLNQSGLNSETKKILIGAICEPPDSNASTFTDSLENMFGNFATNETEKRT